MISNIPINLVPLFLKCEIVQLAGEKVDPIDNSINRF